MKTKKLNVNKEQYDWIKVHERADEIVCSSDKKVVKAIYYSPLHRWSELMRPDGTVDVPDMDYYNKVTDTTEIKSFIDELAEMKI